LEKYFYKFNLVEKLYEKNKLEIGEVLDSYPNTDLYKEILGVKGSWEKTAANMLSELLVGTKHHQDFRNQRQYAFNLILNWLVEDLVYTLLKNTGIKIKRIGSDSKRNILQGKEISALPDLLIENGKNIWIEVISNYPTNSGYSSFWEQSGYFDLRDNKFNHLLKQSLDDDVYVLGVVVSKSKYFKVKINKNTVVKNIQSESNFGYKKTKRFYFENKLPMLIDTENIG
jgi:hypothetical protein